MRDLGALGVFLALACALIWPVVLRGEALLPADYLRAFYPWGVEHPPTEAMPPWNALSADSVLQYLPWRHFARESLRAGFLPLWNPHQLCGTPLIANYQSAVFYLLNVLFWVLPAARAFGVSALLHLFLAGAFLYLYLRGRGLGRAPSLLGGIAFELSGFTVAWLELPTAVNVMVWLPLALHLYERSREGRGPLRGLTTVLPLAMILLAGHPQFALYALFTFGVYTVAHLPEGRGWRDRVWGLAACAGVPLGIALLLAMPQALPMLELSRMSHRSGGSLLMPSSGSYRHQALPFWASVVLFAPGFFGNPARGEYFGPANYAEFVGYAGVLPLILALAALLGPAFPSRRAAWLAALPPGAARRAWFFGALTVAAVAASFRTPLGVLFHSVVPGLGSLGSPGRMLCLFSVAVAALAAFGAQGIIGRRGAAGGEAAGTGGEVPADGSVLAAAAGVIGATGLGLGWSAGLAAGAPLALAAAGLAPGFLGLLALGGAVAWLSTSGRLSPGLARVLLPGLVATDLMAAGWGLNATAPPEMAYPETGITASLRALDPGARFLAMTPRWSLDRYPVTILPPNSATASGLNDVNGYDSLYLLSYKSFLNRVAGGETSPQANGNMVLFQAYAAPEFPSLACRYVLTLDPIADERFELVADGPVRIYRAKHALPRAFLAASPAGDPLPGGEAELTAAGPTRLTAELKGKRGGTLVLLDARYPGWKAAVDGKPVRIEPAREVFRAVRVPEGARQGSFRYEPASFRVGLFLGLIGAGLLAAGVAFACRGARGQTGT
ncbi:MAG: hypothetical protein HY321_16340 [Armatimonadetes bacterium]|nr:hypothetical protein [Armatimonadota bacterium]